MKISVRENLWPLCKQHQCINIYILTQIAKIKQIYNVHVVVVLFENLNMFYPHVLIIGKLQDLKNLALSYKDVITDPEKNLGRFNKEDKISGNRNCDEKLDWIEQNRDIASLEQIIGKIDELQNQLKNTMLKLSDT